MNFFAFKKIQEFRLFIIVLYPVWSFFNRIARCNRWDPLHCRAFIHSPAVRSPDSPPDSSPAHRPLRSALGSVTLRPRPVTVRHRSVLSPSSALRFLVIGSSAFNRFVPPLSVAATRTLDRSFTTSPGILNFDRGSQKRAGFGRIQGVSPEPPVVAERILVLSQNEI